MPRHTKFTSTGSPVEKQIDEFLSRSFSTTCLGLMGIISNLDKQDPNSIQITLQAIEKIGIEQKTLSEFLLTDPTTINRWTHSGFKDGRLGYRIHIMEQLIKFIQTKAFEDVGVTRPIFHPSISSSTAPENK